ncbi:carbohydrate ABC transporter permease [Senegalia massiliensis]|uniref:Sugar ABC transporter permease n=1 Tax=Senegalia massiliensis TaxID=1720316 RepID=A0A845QZW1_9CLOT|nr:sugar ABC transporter permease [Senegalia massiliensis]NBI05893.1 sugar ABC transporter permease [Senegalia massiliensis]
MVNLLKKLRLNTKTAPYYFLIPVILVFSIFMLYPIGKSFWLSFYEFQGGEYNFIGFSNYINLMKDDVFIQSLLNTLIYLIFQVPVMVFLSLLLAYLLDQAYIKFKPMFRVSIFLPAVTSLVAYSLVFKLLLNNEYGLINYLLNVVGLDGVNWLNGPISSKIAIMISITWRWTGYNMIIMLAGLQRISPDIYEASDIDGANKIQKFFHVTLPLMKPIILFAAITSTIGTLQLFDEPYILTDGGPDGATMTVAQYLYNNGFRYIKFGYAAAISYVLVIIIAILSYIQFKVGGDEE